MTFLLRIAFFFAAVWYVLLAPATAHDVGCKGIPVEPAVKSGCCGVADALQVPPESVRQEANGVWHIAIDGADHEIRDTNGAPLEMLPSNDGCYWIWYRRQNVGWPPFPPANPHGGKGSGYHFYCFQGPYPV